MLHTTGVPAVSRRPSPCVPSAEGKVGRPRPGRPVRRRQRHLRAGPQEPQKLLEPRPHLLQADDVVHKQLDAHQNHQTLRGTHPPRTQAGKEAD